jgi:hypothetical protein
MMSVDPDNGGISRRALLGGAAAAVVLGGGAGLGNYELDHHPIWRRRIFGCGSTPPIPPSDYRIVNGTMRSAAMGQSMGWQVALPPARSPLRRVPLVLVLTGATGTPTSLSEVLGMPGFATAAGLPLAFACPASGGPLYYHPRSSGEDPMTWILEEFLPMAEHRFGVGGSAANRAIYGWSMGGYAALLYASLRPRRFCAVAASSPAVFPSYDAADTGHANLFDSQADWERWGLWNHLSDLTGVPVMINCGDGDYFAAAARHMLGAIPGAVGGISPGCHLQSFWHGQEPAQLRFLARQLPQRI